MEKSNLEDTKRSLELLKMMEAEKIQFLTPSEELREEEWNDQIFKEEYIDKFPVFQRPTVAEFANAARQFLNMYMTGEIGSVDYEKVLLILFGGMKIGTDYLGAEKFHSSVGNESPKSLYVSEASIIEDLKPQFSPSVGRGATVPGGQTQASLSNPISVDDAKAWYKLLMDILSKQIPDSSDPDSEEDGEITKKIELAANYVGLLALKTMRMIVQTQAQTVAHIRQKQYCHFLQLWGKQLVYETPPPHRHFLDRVNPFVKRFSGSGIRLLTYLIGSYLSDTVLSRQRILHASIVLPLRQLTTRGMFWLTRAKKSLACDLVKCFEDEMGSAVEDEIRNIEDFLLSCNGKSWVWARLFRDRALLRISCRRLPIISVGCAAIIHGNDPSHFIWKTAQFKEVIKDDTKFKIGLRMSTIIRKKSRRDTIMKMIPLTPQAEQVFLMLKSEYLSGESSD